MLKEFNDIADDTFGDNCADVSLEDWNKFFALDTNIHDRAADIRLLFLPLTTDYISSHGQRKSGVKWPLPAEYYGAQSLPRLRGGPTIKGVKYSSRRPGFLSSFNDQAYLAAFKYLYKHPRVIFPTW